MGTKVSVNMRTVVHKKSTGIAVGFPDACKTPTPGGPVPIPYPNVAQSSDTAKPTKKVKCDKEGVCVKGSNFRMSAGDEAGSAGGGVASSKIKGKAEFANFSFDVKFEGKTVARLGDPMTANGGQPNLPDPAETQAPAPGVAGRADEEACERLKEKQVTDPDQAAIEHGMQPEHAKAFRETCMETGKSASVRQGNTDCLGKIADGFASKPAGNLGGTLKSGDLGDLPSECAGLVAPQGGGGISTISDRVISSGELRAARGRMSSSEFTDWMRRQGAMTGDYDMHDLFDGRGRIHNGSPAETRFRNAVNENIGPTDSTGRMVQHGPQASIDEYYEGPENVPPELERARTPDPGKQPPKPVMHFDENGQMYKIENEQDLKDLYACKGAKYPEHWPE